MAERADAKMKLRRDRFDQGQEASKPQRERELDALSFYAGNHWPADVKLARQGQQAQGGLPAVPARPCLVFDTLREPIRQVLNQIRSMDLGIELVAADDFGGQVGTLAEDEIEVREGIVRRIQRASEAEDARLWAVTRAAICGSGAYRVNVRYAPGKTFDQEIVIERIFNGASVTWDPAHQQPDGSDAEWVFIGTDLTFDAYKAEFGTLPDDSDNPVAQMNKEEFVALGESVPGWFRVEGEKETRIVRVVEYFYTVRKVRTLLLLRDGSSVYKDELPDTVSPDDVIDRRQVVEKSIKWEKLDGYQILDETDWQGPDMPVIKVLGEELQPFNDDRIIDGMVQPAKSSAQGLDYMISKAVEEIALSPIPPWLVAAGQIDDFRTWWDQANNRTFPFLPYKTRDVDGNVVGAPVRTPREAQVMDLMSSVQLFREMQKATTGVPTVGLGEIDSKVHSGRAIKELLAQSEQGTSHFLDNLKRAMRYEGQVINHLLYPIYNNRPGRMVSMINGENKPQTAQLAAPLAPGQAPQVQPGQPKQYQLTEDARFNVAINVSKNYDTRRKQESEIVGSVIAESPETMMPLYGDIFFESLDGPGHKQLAERAKLVLDPRVLKAIAAKDSQHGGIPPEVQAIIDGLTAQVQQAQQIIETKQVEQQAKIQTEQIAAEKDIRIKEMQNATQIEIAKINALVKGVVLDGQARNEAQALNQQLTAQAVAQERQQAHEAEASQAQREHDASEAERQRQHDVTVTVSQQAHESTEKDKDRAVASATKEN